MKIYQQNVGTQNIESAGTHLLFLLAFLGFALLLELFTELALGDDPSSCTLRRGLWSGLIFEKV